MATYQPPLKHNGSLNTVFNPSDFSTTNTNPYLPISGGILTGSLGGTSATFTGTVNVSSFTSQTSASVGTLTSTGLATVGSLSSTGSASVGTITSTGLATVGSLSSTGSASVASLSSTGAITSSGGFTLPTTYSAVPTSGQVGGIVSGSMTASGTTITSATLTSFGSFTNLPAGSYLIVANIPIASSAGATISNYLMSISSNSSSHDMTSAVQSTASQVIAASGTICIQIRKVVQITTATTYTVLGTLTTTTGAIQTSASASATALRVG